MDGLSLLTAAPCAIAAGGRTFLLAPLTLTDYGEIENRILAGRADPLAGIRARLAQLDAARRREELGRVFDEVGSARRVTLGDLDRWWQTTDGFRYRFWLMLRKHQPTATRETAAELLRQMSGEELAELGRGMTRCCGWPATWPTAAAAPGEAARIPWCRWASELSRALGWSPAEIGRMTIAQVYIYLGRGFDSTSRRHVPLEEGLALCRRRREDRQRWIDRMMEELGDGR